MGTVKPPLTITSPQRPLFWWKVHTLTLVSIPLYNGHLFTVATFFCPQGGRWERFNCILYKVSQGCALAVPSHPLYLIFTSE